MDINGQLRLKIKTSRTRYLRYQRQHAFCFYHVFPIAFENGYWFKKNFAHNVRYGNSVTFRIWVALEYLQYLDNLELQRFDFCIECTPTDRICQLYHHQVKIMIIYEGTNNLVSGAFLKCFSIYIIFVF